MDDRPLKRFNPLLVSLTVKPTAMVRSATPIHAAELLRRLAEDSALVHDDVVQNDFLDSDDDADDTSADSDSPLLDGYFESGGSDAVVTLTNFTLTEFHFLWAHVELELTSRWASGRGRKSTTTAKDASMMFLCVLKHYGTWQKHAIDFGFKAPTFEKMMYRVLEIVTPVLNKAFICPPSMATQRANSSTFRHYPYALYATDVKFQPALRPTGRFSEAKHYFSNKHKLYGLIVEASVAFPGRLVFLTNHTPGSVSDITIMANHLKDHQRLLEKNNQERLIEDNGEGSEQYQEAWAILADKGYQGGASMLRVIHPKKKPRNGELTADELARNARVSSNRVLVENFFGRVCLLWKIMHSTYMWNEASFD
ncbi:hypothetical protein PC129_g6679 [Phytophthora cactorum]|uniref:DDE Tnp4 domain-containing protein n=2 Tax=Phytophthora cactorum TaxID=29920 RepID=A0A8T1C041_9STRA|nr:hypothetical protein PC111_g7533 [Phytophthora cactorum]KAG2837058.1 hypothetical protein PC112_g5047 [Phytophthora cactorum]KAG2911795.1 hypothetical protein PC117_g19055 [Phytophthora cactorum]KAG2922221.1 hypothetical protein PC114_g5321 [Phytophthora cactorum]KAG2992004.1 hypothetical protein PC118_g4797 [Phytophthora cactorum]